MDHLWGSGGMRGSTPYVSPSPSEFCFQIYASPLGGHGWVATAYPPPSEFCTQIYPSPPKMC